MSTLPGIPHFACQPLCSDCPHHLHVVAYCSAMFVPAWWLLVHNLEGMLKPATRVSTDVVSRVYSLLALPGSWLRRQGLFVHITVTLLCNRLYPISQHHQMSFHAMATTQRVTKDCQNWGSSPGLSFFTQVNSGARQNIRNCSVKSKPRLQKSFWISMPHCLSCVPYQTWHTVLVCRGRKPGWIH